jgi:Rrf2 family iron-sulfur cluster assembly transcriptional regulator
LWEGLSRRIEEFLQNITLAELVAKNDVKTVSKRQDDMHLSVRQEISLSYLEQLFSKLRKNGLVFSIRGPGGGYRLGKCSAQIAVADIISAVNESVDATKCQGKGNCQGGEQCLTHSLWEGLSQRIEEFLQNITLAELVAKNDVKTVSKRQDEIHISVHEKEPTLETIIPINL